MTTTGVLGSLVNQKVLPLLTQLYYFIEHPRRGRTDAVNPGNDLLQNPCGQSLPVSTTVCNGQCLGN